MAKKSPPSAHTLAPWTYSGTEMDCARYWIWSTGKARKYVASVGSCDDKNSEEARANARLIVTAPELLRELKLAYRFLDRIDEAEVEAVECELQQCLSLGDMAAVIADAEGRFADPN